jgi:hypothetical protein
MRRPQLSTGPWICIGLICAAVIAPASVYAATALTKVQIFGTSGTTAANVTPQHQLLTVQIPPSAVVHTGITISNGCSPVYMPPAGKGIVVTSVVYNYGSGTAGYEVYGGLFNGASCTDIVDQIDQVDKYGSVEHVFPTGVPFKAVYATSSGSPIGIFITGYLINAGDVPK